MNLFITISSYCIATTVSSFKTATPFDARHTISSMKDLSIVETISSIYILLLNIYCFPFPFTYKHSLLYNPYAIGGYSTDCIDAVFLEHHSWSIVVELYSIFCNIITLENYHINFNISSFSFSLRFIHIRMDINEIRFMVSLVLIFTTAVLSFRLSS